jgi:hypothetical protein
MSICDGCGREASDAHSRERIERLELATRFRPIHIQVLLIDAAPPVRLEDFFYRDAKDRSARSAASRRYFDQLTQVARAAPSSDIQEESALADFQRRGLFLTYAVECPVENADVLERAVEQLAPTMLKRIRGSYKPRHIALLSRPLEGLIALLETAGFGDRLIVDPGKAFIDPFCGDQQEPAEYPTSVGERIARALTRPPE